MLFIFLISFKLKSSIDQEFRCLADKALEMSKNKIPKQERYEKTIPGDYSLNDAKFTLHRTLVTPKTKDIKGFAIEKQYLALVKRKIFNLDDNFTFIDPSNQKYYSISKLVSGDEQVNIYSTKEITIFDIITNFKYNRKTIKEYTPAFNIDWKETNEYPTLHKMENSESYVSLGIRGTFSNDITIIFNTKYDIYISSKLELDAQILSKINIKDFGEVTNRKLFEKDPVLMNEFDFEFRGISIQIKPFIKGEVSLIDDLYCKMEDEIILNKEYEIHGTKTFEITNYAINDPEWNLQVIQKQEVYSTYSKFIPKDSKFNITPEITLYYSTEIIFGDTKTLFDQGLIVPIRFEFETNQDGSIRSGFSGEIRSSIQMFYKFDEMKICFPSSYKKAESITILKASNKNVTIKEVTTGNIVINDIYHEQNSNSTQNQTFSTSSLLEMTSLYVNKNCSDYLQFHYHVTQNDLSESVAFDFQYFPDSQFNSMNDMNPYLFFVEMGSYYFQPFFLSCKYNYKDVITKNVLQYSNISSIKFNFLDNQVLSRKHNFEIESLTNEGLKMIGNINLWRCQKVLVNKVFKYPRYSLPFTTFDNKNDQYALVLIGSQYGPKIDFNARYVPELGINEDHNNKWTYSPPNSSYYAIYDCKFTKLTKRLNFNGNLSIIRTKNNISKIQMFGAISYVDDVLNSSFTSNNEKYKFMINEGETIDIRLNYKFLRMYIFNSSKSNEYTIHHSKVINSSELIFRGEYFDVICKIDQVGLPVAVKSSFDDIMDSDAIITKVREIDIDDIHGRFGVTFEDDEDYCIFKFNSKYPMKSCFLFMKTTEIIILSKNIQRIGNDIYYIYCENNLVHIPIRRKSKDGRYQIEYLISETQDPQNMRIKKNGTSLLFKSSNIAEALIVDIYSNNYYLLDNAKTQLTYYSIDIDSNSKLLGILNQNYNNNDNPVIIYPSYAYFNANQTSIEVDLRNLYSNAKESGKESFQFYIISEWKELAKIRMINNNYEKESEVVNNIATFTIEVSPGKEIVSTTKFMAICSNPNAINCALTFIPGSGSYQLIKLPTKEGLNTTVRGRSISLIKAPADKPYCYYKLFEGDFTYVRSYQEKTPIRMIIIDNYPYDNINDSQVQEYENPSITTTTPVPHNLKDAYRKFCLRDNYGNILPFSMNYLSNNYNEFFKQLGVNKNIDDSQFIINDNDECIHVDIQMIEKDITKVTSQIIDLDTTNNVIKIEYLNSEDDLNIKSDDKSSKNKSIIYFVIIGVLALVIIVVVIVVVVCVLKRNKKRNNKTTNKERIENDNSNDDDDYVNPLL